MATTNVYFVGVKRGYEKVQCFKLMGKNLCLGVDSFENGIANILPMHMLSVKESAEIVSGLFDESSNFKSELFKAFKCNENTIFKGISFDFNQINLLITKENAEVNKIYEMYTLALEEKEKKLHNRCRRNN